MKPILLLAKDSEKYLRSAVWQWAEELNNCPTYFDHVRTLGFLSGIKSAIICYASAEDEAFGVASDLFIACDTWHCAVFDKMSNVDLEMGARGGLS